MKGKHISKFLPCMADETLELLSLTNSTMLMLELGRRRIRRRIEELAAFLGETPPPPLPVHLDTERSYRSSANPSNSQSSAQPSKTPNSQSSTSTDKDSNNTKESTKHSA